MKMTSQKYRYRRPEWWLDLLRIYWPLNGILSRAMSRRYIGPVIKKILLPLFSRKNFYLTYIPVNAHIDPPVSSVLAVHIIERLVTESAHRIIIRRCSCRDAKKCSIYPIEDSCLLMGEDTRNVDERVARHVSAEEALTHVRTMIARGLIPMTGRVRMDDFYYGIPNNGRMLTVCFCCPCCCSVLNTIRYLPDEVKPNIEKMEGLRLRFDAARCRRCGKCADACFTKARYRNDDGLAYNEALCIGCGRCSTVCPEKAICITVDDAGDAVDAMLARVRSAAKHD